LVTGIALIQIKGSQHLSLPITSKLSTTSPKRVALFAHRILIWALVAGTSLAWITGCGRGGDVTEMPSVDPPGAASRAIELYDKDGSGSLDESELAACPGVLDARSRYDTDGNGQVSQDELTERLKSLFKSSGTAWATVTCQIIQGGRPLAGAKVRFVPEPFLEDVLPPAESTTDGQGKVMPAVADDRLPEELKGSHVMQPGLYRVHIEHANIKQPQKPLGREVDPLARNGTNFVFRL
jgi:hypothetical protein